MRPKRDIKPRLPRDSHASLWGSADYVRSRLSRRESPCLRRRQQPEELRWTGPAAVERALGAVVTRPGNACEPSPPAHAPLTWVTLHLRLGFKPEEWVGAIPPRGIRDRRRPAPNYAFTGGEVQAIRRRLT